MTTDYEFFNRVQLKGRIRALQDRVNYLETKIRKIVTQEGDDICWRDIYTDLANDVGIKFNPKLLNDPDFMDANCKRFTKSIYNGPYIPIYVKINPELEMPDDAKEKK